MRYLGKITRTVYRKYRTFVYYIEVNFGDKPS
jgi:hypothetical protein